MKILYLVYAVIAACTLHNYISWQSVNVVLGIIAMPIVTTVQRDNKQSLRFAWVALFFGALCLCLPVKTLLFFSIVFACFFITESYVGTMNLLPVLVAGIISPVFQFASSVMSFPLRLWLTGVAGSMMNASVAGNMIMYHGNEFSVDPACMGLNMLVVGLLLQVMLIAVFQKQSGVRLSGWLVMVLMALSVVMNVVSNLFRIICLVYFNVLPGTVMHDVMGICCLLVYVVLPMIYVTRWVVKRSGKVMVYTPASATKKLVFIHIVLLVTIGLSAIAVGKANDAPSDIVKLEKEHALIYIKPIRGFYSADHNPTICWRGVDTNSNR